VLSIQQTHSVHLVALLTINVVFTASMANERIKLHFGNTIVYDDLRITFHRTQRLPNTPLGKASPDHGILPFFPVSQNGDKLPDGVVADNGVLLATSRKPPSNLTTPC
jgi:hypothetical protein